MEPSSSSCKSSTRVSSDKFLRRIIWPAIRGKACPICYDELHELRSAVLSACKHAYCYECIRKWSFLRRKCPLCNADFESWFYRINLSTGNFHKQRLLPLNDSSRKFHFREEVERSRRSDFFRYLAFGLLVFWNWKCRLKFWGFLCVGLRSTENGHGQGNCRGGDLLDGREMLAMMLF